MEPNKALIKDEEVEDVDVHLYRSMIGSLMYLTAFRPNITFAVCACVRFQVTLKISHLHAVKRIFRYLKGQPKLGLWYPRDSPFDLEAFSDSDYAGASIDRKYTTGAEYVAAANCCGQVLWIQNQMLDYGFNFINTKIYIDNKSTIYIVKNPVFHSKTKHIEIRHHFIRDSYVKKLIQVIKIHTDHNVADLITKFVDQHNMVACLERIKENADFNQIVDFLTTSSIHYALTEIGSGDRPRCQEAIGGAITQTRVLALEQSKTVQDLVINKLQKKVKRLEKAPRARTPGMKLFKIGTSRKKSLDKENVSKQGKSDKTKPMFKDSDFDVLDDAMENVEGGTFNGSAASPSTSTTGDIFEDEMTTIADTLVAIRSARSRTTSVVIRNVEEEPRRATPVPTVQAKTKREQRIARERATEQEANDAALIEQMEDVQVRMDADELLAARLQEQETRKNFFRSRGRRRGQRLKHANTRTQLRNQMITYLKHMGKYTHNQLKSKSFEEIQKLYKKEHQWINDCSLLRDDNGKKDEARSKQAESSMRNQEQEHEERDCQGNRKQS
ncbi:hypothetical protein Tco_0000015 [Tanacetum coccineum]